MSNSTEYKVVVLGDSGVGKTYTLLKWKETLNSVVVVGAPELPEWMQNSAPTMGADVHVVLVKYKGNTVALKVWDVAGRDELAGSRDLYIKNCDICVIVYNSDESYANIDKWKKMVTKDQPSVPIVLYKNVNAEYANLGKIILDKLHQ